MGPPVPDTFFRSGALLPGRAGLKCLNCRTLAILVQHKSDRSIPGGKHMNVWRWLGLFFFLAAVTCMVGTRLPAGDKDKKDKVEKDKAEPKDKADKDKADKDKGEKKPDPPV